jgi:hypothetical protein
MTPPDYSITLALEHAAWLLQATLPPLAMIVGVPVGATIIMWGLREVKGVLG